MTEFKDPRRHKPKCWRDPMHHDCALRYIQKLRDKVNELIEEANELRRRLATMIPGDDRANLTLTCENCNGTGSIPVGEHLVTAEMASDAGMPELEGSVAEVEYEPCPNCRALGVVSLVTVHERAWNEALDEAIEICETTPNGITFTMSIKEKLEARKLGDKPMISRLSIVTDERNRLEWAARSVIERLQSVLKRA